MTQYERNRQQLGWKIFKQEFLTSLIVNHDGSLVKLKQEGKVAIYIKNFCWLQILGREWSKESLLGIFIEGLKS